MKNYRITVKGKGSVESQGENPTEAFSKRFPNIELRSVAVSANANICIELLNGKRHSVSYHVGKAKKQVSKGTPTTKIRTFATFTEFVAYTEELGDWLVHNEYAHLNSPGLGDPLRTYRNEIMRNESAWFADMKAKGLYAKYQEYYNNCKHYLVNNIVVQEKDTNKRFCKFTPSFRFVNQGREEYDSLSLFVWSLSERPEVPNDGFVAISKTLFALPNNPDNPDYFELGCCWYNKRAYAGQDVAPNQVWEVTTPANLQALVSVIEGLLEKQQPTNVYACMDSRECYSSNGFGCPVDSWTALVPGWSIKRKGDGYEIVSGLKSKYTEQVSMYATQTTTTNITYSVGKNAIIEKALSLLGKPDINEVELRCTVGKGQKEHIRFEGSGRCVIEAVGNDTFDDYFRSFKGEVNDHAYDPAVWGWT